MRIRYIKRLDETEIIEKQNDNMSTKTTSISLCDRQARNELLNIDDDKKQRSRDILQHQFCSSCRTSNLQIIQDSKFVIIMMLFDSKKVCLHLSFIEFLLLYSTITTFYNRVYSNRTIFRDNRKVHARVYCYGKVYCYVNGEGGWIIDLISYCWITWLASP